MFKKRKTYVFIASRKGGYCESVSVYNIPLCDVEKNIISFCEYHHDCDIICYEMGRQVFIAKDKKKKIKWSIVNE
jgi:hypothetical protein